MVFEIILAAILIAFGVLSIYLSVEEGVNDIKLMIILFIGIGSVIAGLWVLIETLTIGLILRKLLGLALAGFGVFLIIGFPDVRDYQRFEMAKSAIFIGLIVFVLGIYFLLF